jgi:hypothetical protein
MKKLKKYTRSAVDLVSAFIAFKPLEAHLLRCAKKL